MHTLTVHGINAAGSPDTGDFAVVMNVDNPAGFGSGAGGVGSFSHGVAKFSVAAGTYWAVGVYDAGFVVSSGSARPRAASSPARMVVLPQFTVSADKTVTVDARTATSAVRFLTPRPAVPQAEQINVERLSPSGQAGVVGVWVNVSSARPELTRELFVNPVSRAPADGTLQSSSAAELFSPASAPSPYQYYPVVRGPKGTIPPQDFRVSAGSLATVHENLYAGAPTATGGFSEVGFLPSQPGLDLDVLLSPELSFPGRDTVYLSAVGGSAVWQGTYSPVATYYPGGQSGPWVSYRPGEVTTEDWNAYPLHTAPNVNLLGAVSDEPMVVSANRSGDVLTLAFMPFSDSAYGHLGTGYTSLSGATVSGTYRIRQNGKTIATGNALNSPGIPTGEIYHQATLSPKPSVITFTLTANRTGNPFTLSTATSTTWTWRSAHESGATVPRWWYCSFAQNHDCAAQPLLMLGYQVRGLALNGAAPAGAQSLTVTAGHLQLAAAQKVTKVTVQASFDDGKTWTDAAVTGSGGSYDARFTAPAGRKVTLRVTALDAAGGQVSETITRAYATAPRPGTPRGQPSW